MSSMDSGVPAIGMEDGYVLFSTAYLTALKFGQLQALDAGAGVGFSTMWVARALDESGISGVVYAVERSANRFKKLKGLVARHGLGNLVIPINGDALECIKEIEGLNLVFVDIDKESYPEFFLLVKDRIAKGGVVLAHNVKHPWGSIGAFLKEASRDGWKTIVVPTDEGMSISVRTS